MFEVYRDHVDHARALVRQSEENIANKQYVKCFKLLEEAMNYVYDYPTPEATYLKEKIDKLYKLCQKPPVNKEFSKEATFGKQTIVAFVNNKDEYTVACKASDDSLYYKRSYTYEHEAQSEWDRRHEILSQNPHHIFG